MFECQEWKSVKAKSFIAWAYTHTHSSFYVNEMCKIVRAHTILSLLNLRPRHCPENDGMMLNAKPCRNKTQKRSYCKWYSEWAIYSLLCAARQRQRFVCIFSFSSVGVLVYNIRCCVFLLSLFYFIECICVCLLLCLCVYLYVTRLLSSVSINIYIYIYINSW